MPHPKTLTHAGDYEYFADKVRCPARQPRGDLALTEHVHTLGACERRAIPHQRRGQKRRSTGGRKENTQGAEKRKECCNLMGVL